MTAHNGRDKSPRRFKQPAPGNIVRTVALACGAYLPGQLGPGKTAHVHAAEIHWTKPRANDEVVRVICGGAKAESVLPDAATYGELPATCPRCIERLAAFGITGMEPLP